MAEAPHTDKLALVRGEPFPIGDFLVIEGPNHQRLQELQAEGETIGKALRDALENSSGELTEKLAAFKRTTEALPDKELAQHAALEMFTGRPQTVTLSPESQAAIDAFKGIIDEHFPTQFKAVADFAERNAAEIAERTKAELALIESARKNPLMVEGYERRFRKSVIALLDKKAADLADTVKISELLATKPATVPTEVAAAETAAKAAAASEAPAPAVETPKAEVPPAAAAEAPKTEINIGDLVIENGKAEFKNASHPAAKEAHIKINAKAEALLRNLGKEEFYREKKALENEFGTYRNGKTVDRSGDVKNAINEALHGNFKPLQGDLPAGAKEKIEALFEKHAKTQYSELKTEVAAAEPVLLQAKRELLEAQIKHLESAVKDMPEMESALTTLKSGLQKELEGLNKAPKITSSAAAKDAAKEEKAVAGEAKKEGFWTQQIKKAKENLGVEAYEASKLKTAARYFGLGAGVGLIGDAALRSTAKDENGNRVERSGLGRATEAVIGAAVTTGSAIIGGRGK